MTMMSSLLRIVARRRQLHTIITSKEIIKPSSPTPSHLKTYNLSVYDQFIPSTFVPLILFYPNTNISHQQTLDLKNSLSRTLTKYYPFAGRHARIAPTYVDCNDHGAEFIEASVDRDLSDFLQNSPREDYDRLFPHQRTWNNSIRSDTDDRGLETNIVIPLAVQFNRFVCGGISIAVSLSHKIADDCSLIHFMTDWAEMTCSVSEKKTLEPSFICFEETNVNFSGFSLELTRDCVTSSFVFPNVKINELKLQLGATVTNPTRVEVLTWLLYKCAVSAATKNNSGSFEPTRIRVATNLRDKMMEPLPEKSIGNFLTGMQVESSDETKLKPEFFISELRNQKKKIKGLRNLEAAFAPLMNLCLSGFDIEERQRKFEKTYICSSICGISGYGIDFGWGKPIKSSLPGNLRKNSFVLMDASNGEGIEAMVCLGKQDMDVIQRDPELLHFVD